MIRFVEYVKATGVILAVREQAAAPSGSNEFLLIGQNDFVDPNFHRVVDRQIKLIATRPPQLVTEEGILAQIDIDRGVRQMMKLTRGTGVAQEYVAIQNEFADYKGVLATVLATIGLADRQKRWPTAMTEVALTGDSLGTVMARYGTAIASNEVSTRSIGRIAVQAKARVKAATTLAQKQQIYGMIDWTWTPGF